MIHRDEQEWVALLRTPLNNDSICFVSTSQAGGVAAFVGMTRAERNNQGQDLLALDYDAYSEMAFEQMKRLSAEARTRWPILKLALLHRLGRVGLGEASVSIAVSTPHRADAFEACRWLIDTLKAQVPIWKKEIWDDGSETWVHPPPNPDPRNDG